jgi:hypothetical protein
MSATLKDPWKRVVELLALFLGALLAALAGGCVGGFTTGLRVSKDGVQAELTLSGTNVGRGVAPSK